VRLLEILEIDFDPQDDFRALRSHLKTFLSNEMSSTCQNRTILYKNSFNN
jgi:hypothetical protein